MSILFANSYLAEALSKRNCFESGRTVRLTEELNRSGGFLKIACTAFGALGIEDRFFKDFRKRRQIFLQVAGPVGRQVGKLLFLCSRHFLDFSDARNEILV